MTENPSDAEIRSILTRFKRFACVGVSANPIRPSNYVARYLSLKGFEVTAVNPGLAGQVHFGKPAVASVSDLTGPVDVVDIFRRAEAVPAIVDAALSLDPLPSVIWMQIGIKHAEAAAKAAAAGLIVIQDRCPKIEYQRHFGELRMGGFSTGLISSRLP